MSLTHHILKRIAHDAPAQIIQRTSRRNRPGTAKDDGSNDVPQPRLCAGAIPPLRAPEEQPDNQRHHGAQDKKRKKGGVDLARGEHPRGANQSPDDARGEEDASVGAGEVLRLSGGTDLGDGAEGIVKDQDLDHARERRGDDLHGEQHARRQFHVVPEFQVADEGQRLRHGDVAEGLEDHERERPAGLDVPEDEFG